MATCASRGRWLPRAATAYVPEQVALYPHLSGIENLQYYRGGGDQSKTGLDYLKKETETTGKNVEDVLMENDSQDDD